MSVYSGATVASAALTERHSATSTYCADEANKFKYELLVRKDRAWIPKHAVVFETSDPGPLTSGGAPQFQLNFPVAMS